MKSLLHEFQQFHGQGTKQIGRYFCIPAATSNALRLFGGNDFTQERIRDLWYAENGRTPETEIDKQMMDAGPGVVTTLQKHTDFDSRFETATFSARPLGKLDKLFYATEAEDALSFIVNHVAMGHPVFASKDFINRVPGAYIRVPSHMWLILEVNEQTNTATFHDSGNDKIDTIDLRAPCKVKHINQELDFDSGLRGMLTVSSHFCQAFWSR